MKKNILISFLLLWVLVHPLQAQTRIQNKKQLAVLGNTAPESVYIHFNDSFLLTGEYLYYSFYCLNTETSLLSGLSKIGYVELISANGDVIFKHKLRLKNGVGQSDYFVPTSLKSGSYKLVGYTQWMQNGTSDLFFQNDIHIINPYQGNQFVTNNIEKEGLETKQSLTNKPNTRSTDQDNGVVLQLKDSVFKKRSKVEMLLKSLDTTFSNGIYSISVRKKNSFKSPAKTNFQGLNYLKQPKYLFNNVNASYYLPELRGSLIKGTISSNNNDKPIERLKVAMSIPGEKFYFGIAYTNDRGIFYQNIDSNFANNKGIVQILNENTNDYQIKLEKHKSPQLDNLVFSNLYLDSLMRKDILQRSIHNQVENAYFLFKPDSILSTPANNILSNKAYKSYKLDDYSRFELLEETIFEIVKDVSIKKVSKETSALFVQGYNYNTNTGILPLLLLDGILIQNHDQILNMKSAGIDEIVVYRDQFIVGPSVFQGAILLKSRNLDQEGNYDTFGSTYELLSTQLTSKKYFNQIYDVNTKSKIPDDRLQLLWLPNLTTNENEAVINFYTSDIKGAFEITIQGISSNGKTTSISRTVVVE
ncbi:hypothetical protein ABN763_07950 [Spongiivirga sp. MCCC 1A20706]|uniref:hypothetical protein n=1 Tax=Spongiivirga sp. MCCC 1A20706 TaxID=3160963 RepID=UPI003977AAB3